MGYIKEEESTRIDIICTNPKWEPVKLKAPLQLIKINIYGKVNLAKRKNIEKLDFRNHF